MCMGGRKTGRSVGLSKKTVTLRFIQYSFIQYCMPMGIEDKKTEIISTISCCCSVINHI